MLARSLALAGGVLALLRACSSFGGSEAEPPASDGGGPTAPDAAAGPVSTFDATADAPIEAAVAPVCPGGASFCDDFERGPPVQGPWSSVEGDPPTAFALDSTRAHAGTRSLTVKGSGSRAFLERLLAPGAVRVHARLWLLHPTAPTDFVSVVEIPLTSGGSILVKLLKNSLYWSEQTQQPGGSKSASLLAASELGTWESVDVDYDSTPFPPVLHLEVAGFESTIKLQITGGRPLSLRVGLLESPPSEVSEVGIDDVIVD